MAEPKSKTPSKASPTRSTGTKTTKRKAATKRKPAKSSRTKAGAKPPSSAPAKKTSRRKKATPKPRQTSNGRSSGNSGKYRKTSVELAAEGQPPAKVERTRLREFEQEMAELAQHIDELHRPAFEAREAEKKKLGHDRGGVPPFFPTVAQRHRVLMTASMGLKRGQVAVLVINPATSRPISEDTLAKAFRDELELGVSLANAAVSQSLFAIATGDGPGSVRAAVWWEKTRMGMSDRVTVEVDAKAGVLVAPATKSVDQWVADNAEIRDADFEVTE